MSTRQQNNLRDRFLADLKAKDFSALRLDYEANIRRELLSAETEFSVRLAQAGDRALVDRLVCDGTVEFSYFSTAESNSLYDELEAEPVHDGHAPNASKGIEYRDYRGAAGLSYSHYPVARLLKAKVIRERVLQDSRLLSIARGYLGAPANLYDIGCFWAYPGSERHPFSQMWHRDWDDYKFLAFFTFLTDVESEDDGFHKFVLGSHLPDFPQDLMMVNFADRLIHMGRSAIEAMKYGPRQVRGYCGSVIAHLTPSEIFGKRKLHPYYERVLASRIRTFKGPRGTSFLEDAGGLHVGELPRKRPRLLLWIRYGVTQAKLTDRGVG